MKLTMNFLRILLFLSSIFLFAQKTDNLKIKSDSTKSKEKRVIFVAFDVFGASKILFADQTKISGMITSRVYKGIHAVVEVGYHSGTYDNLNWIMNGKGTYYKVGVNYFFSKDYENKHNGFYTGGKLAFSSFSQEIEQYPIYGYKETNTAREIFYKSFPAENTQAFWLEFTFGARVQLAKSKFYLLTEFQPKVGLSLNGQNNIESLFIPGLGKNKTAINFDMFMGIAYQF